METSFLYFQQLAEDNLNRYERNLGTIDHKGQAKLAQATVMIVGLGGLGGYVLESMARIGIGSIIGVDQDVLEETNLNRQILALSSNIGKAKTEAARERVSAINPQIQFTGFKTNFEALEPEVFKSAQLIFDGLDTLPARKKLLHICQTVKKPLIHGAIAGWCGQVGVINSNFENLFNRQTEGIESKLGNLAFTAGFTANLMVAKAVPILLEEEKAENYLVFFDLRNDDFEKIKF